MNVAPGKPSYDELVAENALLRKQLAEAFEVIAQLGARVEYLEARLGMDSKNSSKPT